MADQMSPRNRYAVILVTALALMLLAGDRCNAQSVPAGVTAKKAGLKKCDRTHFRLLLDVGHTEEAHGAISARNVAEYVFNLRLAREIDRRLIEDGFTRTVLLVTHGSAQRSLIERVTVANRLSASLFLSIHHDSVPDKFLENW